MKNSTKNFEQIILEKEKAIKVIYVSSYIPRKCGIATFTKDLTNAINLLNPHALAEIMALVKNDENISYPWEVKFKINQDSLSSFLSAVEYINKSSADIICIQHEFGLFGGNCGEYVIPFVESIQKPIVSTLHTVISDPSGHSGEVLKRLIDKSAAVTVMMKETKERLIKDYKINPSKIVTIPHGTPDLSFDPTEPYKRRKRLKNKIILGNINLLSRNKGIEYALEAVSIIAKEVPNVLYLVIGQTHPDVLRHEGEKYRKSLYSLIKKLGIKKNVKFVNKYLTLEELIQWLKTIDFYITPYLDPQQSSSGALAYAVGAGKVCISTPYLYASEVLSEGRGILVPFKNSKAIAEAVLEIIKNEKRKETIQKKAYDYGRLMTWSSVALKFLNLFKVVLGKSE
ncbi:MAG: glycosyltransferase family 4 protein [Nitrososphaeria archaeon]